MPIAIHGNGGDGSKYWNYTNPNKAEYSPQITGTIVQIAEVQDTQWDGTKQVPKTWRDGNPVMAIQFTILEETTGQDYKFRFGLGKNSQMVKAIERALPGSNDMEDLAGAYVRITSPQGVYNSTNPRPFNLEIGGWNKELYRGTIYFDPSQAQTPQNSQAQTSQGFGNQNQTSGFGAAQGNPQNFQGQQQQSGFEGQQQQPGGFGAQSAGAGSGFGASAQSVGQGAPAQGGFAQTQQGFGGQPANGGNVFNGAAGSTTPYDESIPF